MGLGIWLAWLYLAQSGTVWLSDVEIDGSNLATLYMVSTAATALILLASPFLRGYLDALLRLRAGVLCGALLSMLGAVSVILAGPYYLGLSFLFQSGNVLMGIGSALIALKCGQLYGGLQPQRALIYTLLSQFVLVLVFYFVVGNSFWQPVAGGPSLGGILALVFLPLLAAYLVSIRLPQDQNDDTLSPASFSASPPDEKAAEQNSIKGLPPVFWKFLFAILVFTLAASVAQGYYTTFRLPAATLSDSLYVMLFRIVFALGFMLLVIRFLKNVMFSKLYLLCMVIIAIAFAVLPLFKIDSALFSGLIGFVFSIFDVLVWCLLAFVVYEKRISSTIVFGFGRGIFMAGSALGWLLGALLLHSLAGTSWETVFYVVLAFLILLSTTLVFTEKDFDRLFAPLSSKEGQPGNLVSDLTAAKLYRTDDDSRRERPWFSACKNLGEKARLSIREQEVLELLALGRSSEHIASRLSISLNTVRTHTQNVYAKLDVHSRQELTVLVETERDTLERA
jgi:DNA-binding CsgD family transcriptional regulator